MSEAEDVSVGAVKSSSYSGKRVVFRDQKKQLWNRGYCLSNLMSEGPRLAAGSCCLQIRGQRQVWVGLGKWQVKTLHHLAR